MRWLRTVTWVCTGVHVQGGTALALTEATSRDGQTTREGGTESHGSLGDGRVANWTAQTVRLSVRRRNVERGPLSPQPGKSPGIPGQPRSRHRPSPHPPSARHAAVLVH